MNTRSCAYLAAVLNAFFIGLSFLFVKESLDSAAPFTTLAFRFTLSFLVLLGLAAVGVIRVRLPQERYGDLLVLLIAQPILFFSLQAFSLLYISSSEAGIIEAITPVFVGILGIVVLGEWVNAKQFICFFISLAGIACLFLMEGNGGAGIDTFGLVLAVLSVCATSLYIVMGRRLSRTIDPVSLTFLMMLSGCVIFLGAAMGCEGLGPYGALVLLRDTDFLIEILYLALFTSVATSFFAMYSLRELEAARVGIIQNLSVVVSVGAGVLVLHEPFLVYHAVASLLIVAGVVFANYYAGPEMAGSGGTAAPGESKMKHADAHLKGP
ncbi:drug/metabolite transporter (DMT)-like permease [Methanofollis sp. W23]|uniref:DMT family transporter n=1 Tax=Methanofollis sp. W23 TaxID=2817849 RepID=UPI001AE18751|nr:DMT family transporter [Methanofollis sp. W23]MBP2146815.1 drug/metabolite transporter (DMT)-like permease [Methanofollis sp. W23]